MRMLILVLAAALAGCVGLFQTEDQVFKRERGETLSPWKSTAEASSEHWPYAWASVAAYQDPDDPKRGPLQTTQECPAPNSLLKSQQWVLWNELPQLKPKSADPRADKIYKVHLRPQVWANRTLGIVIVAFGGTAFKSLEDWKANLRWFIDPIAEPEDAYFVLSHDFIPWFVEAYNAKSATDDGAWLKSATIVAAGHSLGGGLAQRFAYSLRKDQGVPRVETVYAFNPSPVSGKRGVPSWEENAKGLTIYRIYNRGEFLATIRSILSWVTFGDGDGQTWIDIRYLDDWKWETAVTGMVHAHQMFMLACFMKKNAGIPSPTDPAATSTK